MRWQSDKRRAEQQVRREIAFHYPHERCWVGLEGCTGWAEAWHELVGSGQGGSRSDPRNLCASCNHCNRMIERLDDRFELGLKIHTSKATKGDGGLVPEDPHPLSLAERWL